jgi:hypothetical protein
MKKQVRRIFLLSMRRQAVAGCVIENTSWPKVGQIKYIRQILVNIEFNLSRIDVHI